MAAKRHSRGSRSKSESVSPEEKAGWLRAAAHPVRLVVLRALAEGPKCVKDLNALVPIAQPHLSQHMAVLRRSGLVEFHSEGNLRCYYLTRPSFVRSLLRLLDRPHPLHVLSKEVAKREAQRRKPGGFRRRKRGT